MTDSTLTFRVDEELKTAFAEAARSQDRNAAQLLREYMRTVVRESRDKREHEAWFREQVSIGRRAAENGDVRSSEEVERQLAQLRGAASST